jgi:2-hydroxychromene-2-carboxylate isomerase
MPAMQPKLEFWYDFASTYSYLSAVRIEALAAGKGVEVAWRPFLLGPIFKAQGWATSPFNLYPAKGRYMIRDMERISSARGLVFHMPNSFPQNGLNAARLALVGAEEGWIGAFTRAVFAAEFAEQRTISDASVLETIVEALGLDFARVFARSGSPEIKQRLRAETERAEALGLFGAPSFVTVDGELFWGDDRLEQAVAHAARL